MMLSLSRLSPSAYLPTFYHYFTYLSIKNKKSALANAFFVLIRINFVAHDGCATLTLCFFYGGGDFLAVKVNTDNLRATALAVTSHCAYHSGV